MMPSIAIVGCGPSGMASAIMLHDAGFKVTLVEQFEQPRPVGSGLMLQPTGLKVLDSMGLREDVEGRGQRIDGMFGRLAGSGKTVLDIRYKHLSESIYGVAIHRAALFDILFSAVQSRNLPLINHSSIAALHYLDDEADGQSTRKIRLLTESEQSVEGEFDLIIDASGAQSRLTENSRKKPNRRQLAYGALWTTVRLDSNTFDRMQLEQRYVRSSVMAGVLPCGSITDTNSYSQVDNQDAKNLATFFWSIKDSDLLTTKRLGLEFWKREVLSVWPETVELLEQITHWDQLIHATYSHHTLRYPFGRQIAFVGDCAHATSPQLGQGANMGLLDAYALSRSLHSVFSSGSQPDARSDEEHSANGSGQLVSDIQQALELYADKRRTHVMFYQSACYFLTPFYQSDSRLLPMLRDFIFEPLSRIPFVRKQMTSLGSGMMFNSFSTLD